MIGELRSRQAGGLRIGDRAPEFDLPAAGGGSFVLPATGDAAATVVVFTCNHCPYALAWEDRILAAGADYAAHDVPFFAINSNDAERYAADSFAEMEQRVAEHPWPIPYLRDESQDVARAYGAQVTPDVFVFDRELRLAYNGAPDTDYEDPSLDAAWLRGAVDAVLAGAAPDPAETKPIGCSIKWRA